MKKKGGKMKKETFFFYILRDRDVYISFFAWKQKCFLYSHVGPKLGACS